MKALRFRLPLNTNSELKKTELLSSVPSELAPLPLELGQNRSKQLYFKRS